MNPRFDIGRAQPHILANRTPTLFLKRLQNPPPRRISHSMQNPIQFLLRLRHAASMNHRIDGCQCIVSLRSSGVSPSIIPTVYTDNV